MPKQKNLFDGILPEEAKNNASPYFEMNLGEGSIRLFSERFTSTQGDHCSMFFIAIKDQENNTVGTIRSAVKPKGLSQRLKCAWVGLLGGQVDLVLEVGKEEGERIHSFINKFISGWEDMPEDNLIRLNSDGN